MKRIVLLLLSPFFSLCLFAQVAKSDTSVNGNSIIHKDVRIDMLGKKMAEYNESLALKIQLVNGYRLMLLNTTDREQAMKVRATMMQQYPDQKIYMAFLTPYIKLKVGNFTDKKEAEKFRKTLMDSKIVTSNIYVLSEKVEQKPVDKNAVQPAE